MKYELTLGAFKGPLETLLELIEDKKLEITEISLGQITEDFFAHLRRLAAAPAGVGAHENLRLLADFIVVASRLILIKSKSLLPDLTLTQEEERDIQDLQDRLKLYRQIKPAMKLFHRAWKSTERQYSRPYFWNIFASHSRWGAETHFFFPGNGVTADALAGSLARIFESLEKISREEHALQETIISLEEEMTNVVSRLTQEGSTHFSRLSSARSRAQVIVLFLAVLHLVRDQCIRVEQQGHFSDIMITHDQPRG